jgi:myosin-crossreactive antigen
MMSRERALLQKVLTGDDDGDYFVSQEIHKEILELLNEPEQKPLDDKDIEVWYSQHTWAMDKEEYMWGFRDAEIAHGIGR